MFSNAGIAGEPISSILDVIKNVFNVNVVDSFLCAKHVARVMISTKTNGVLYLATDDSKYVSGLNLIIHVLQQSVPI